MAAWSDVTPSNPESGTFTMGGASFPAGTGGTFIMVWSPTARPAEQNTGTPGAAIDKMVRTNSTCFARGVKESIVLQTNSGLSWMWRRICFTLKGTAINDGNSDPATSEVFRQTSSGMMRLMTHDDATIGRLLPLLFRGQQGTDWQNFFLAKVDTMQVGLKYDRTRVINSGNDTGKTIRMSLWHAMNKNIYYRDDENGDLMTPNAWSVESKQGMGDYYIVDIVQSNGGDSVETLNMDINARYYWHER